jgi:hypothetical protein
MAIQKMQNQHDIGFLTNPIKEEKISQTNEGNKTSLRDLSMQQKAKIYNPKNTALTSDKSIMSSKAGNITEIGGPSKFIGSESGNSIFNSAKIEIAAKEKENEKQTLNDPKLARQQAEKERLDKLVAALKEIDQRKSSTVSTSGTYQGDNYKTTHNNMSIFDTNDFERLPEKTAGETTSEETQKRRSQKDESWKHNGKTTSSSDVINRMFDNLNGKIVGK